MERVLTLAQAAEATGLTRKALQRRIDRRSIQSVLRGGQRRIPVSELVRAGLLEVDPHDPERVTTGQVTHRAPQSPARGSGGATRVSVPPIDLDALLDRLERQAETIGELRALTAHAESLQAEAARLREEAEAERTARQSLEQELAETRAALAAAAAEREEQPQQQKASEPRRGFWARFRGAAAKA